MKTITEEIQELMETVRFMGEDGPEDDEAAETESYEDAIDTKIKYSTQMGVAWYRELSQLVTLIDEERKRAGQRGDRQKVEQYNNMFKKYRMFMREIYELIGASIGNIKK